MSDLAKLRVPFPPEAVGKLPRVTCKACRDSSARHCNQHQLSRCRECNNYITSAHIHLDYVGHAEVTDRLLNVDPSWSWEPFALDAHGLPLVQQSAGGQEFELWIRLTVCGTSRPGVGTCPKGSFEASKQLISDALRNASMRFGVALDLWAKSDLHKTEPDDQPIPSPPLGADPAPEGAESPASPFGKANSAPSPSKESERKEAASNLSAEDSSSTLEPAGEGSGEEGASLPPRDRVALLVRSLRGEESRAYSTFLKTHLIPSRLDIQSDEQVAAILDWFGAKA